MLAIAHEFPKGMSYCSVLTLELQGFSKGFLPYDLKAFC